MSDEKSDQRVNCSGCNEELNRAEIDTELCCDSCESPLCFCCWADYGQCPKCLGNDELLEANQGALI